jgi:hypothetical protein
VSGFALFWDSIPDRGIEGLNAVRKLFQLELSLLRALQQPVSLIIVQLPQDGQKLKYTIIVLVTKPYVSRSSIESEAFFGELRCVQQLMNRIQYDRRRDVPPEAHDHAGKIIVANNKHVLFAVSGHGKSE